MTSSIVIVVGVIAIIAFAFYIARKIIKPIRELTEGTIDIANGKFDRRIHIYNYDELNQLADGFNCMAEHIEATLKELQAAKDYNDNILVSVPSILIVLNNQLNILSTNVAFEKIHKQYPSLTLNDLTAKMADDIKKNIDTGKTIHNEITIVPTGTKAKLIFVSTVSFIGDDEHISDTEKARVLLTLTDITERRKMKELVMQSMRDWEDTFNTIPDMITIHDMDFNILHANRAAKEVLKLEGVDLTQQTKCFKHYHGMDERPKACPSCDCLKTGLPITFELFEPHLGKFIEIRSIPRITKDNEFIGQIHIARDISARKKIEDEHAELLKAVTKAKIEWEMTFDSALENIVIIDKNLLITRCNKSFSEYVNRSINDIIGHKCYEFFPCSDQTAGKCKLCLENSKDLPIKSEIKTPSGRWLYVSHRPIKDEKGISAQSIIIATDISEIKQTQEKLNASKEALNNKVADLERFYDMAIGRELKMKQLKKEIKKLNAALENYDINKNEYTAK
ncbi:MAG TPA: PAS domain S-box protein [Nitrospirae bacterium]|nr:PAS domain S-box protein [Nitrospirota bacterium]HEW81758.1 PAS domain S-box protein [Nitrospirota bacterium]